MVKKVTFLLVASISYFSFRVSAQEMDTTLYEMSLQELMDIEITSVSKRSQKQHEVAAATYVINQADIRRSGATRLQDLLQMMVPGVFFNFNNYNDSDFGLRQNTDGFLGSVLVLVNNVPYQSPYSSSFNFANFDISFDEIERIEVIRGPGGTIYGANAATGVINIFTKKPDGEENWSATLKQGTRGLVAPEVRYATQMSEKSHIKVFAKGNFFNGFKPMDEFDGEYVTVPAMNLDPNTNLPDGTSSGTTVIENSLNADVYETNKIMTGLELQSNLGEGAVLSTHFFYFNHKRNMYAPSVLSPDTDFILLEQKNKRVVSSVRLDKSFNDMHNVFFQLSENKESTDESGGIRSTSTLNFEAQDNLQLGMHRLSSGLNLRRVDFRIGPLDPSLGVRYTENNDVAYLWGVFVQDQLIFNDKLDATVGIKAETWTLVDHKPEFSPSARIAYKPTKKITFWGAASRSVTTPGFIQTNIELTLVPANQMFPYRIALINGDDTDQSEYLTSEVGFKTSWDHLALDITGFYSKADKLVGVATGEITPSPVNSNEDIYSILYANVYEADNYGVESVLKFFPTSSVRFELSHAWFKTDIEGKNNPVTGEKVEYIKPSVPQMPEHVFRLKSYFTLPSDIEFTVNSMYHTKTGTNAFLYDQQRTPGLGEVGYQLQKPEARYRVDFKIEKVFNNRKTSVFLWGNDIFNNGYLANYNSLQTGIPMQIHRIIGAGASVKL